MSEETFIKELLRNKQSALQRYPDRQLAHLLLDGLFEFLFVGQARDLSSDKALELFQQLKNTFAALLSGTIDDGPAVKAQTGAFFSVLPSIYKALLRDAHSIYESDPAAKSISEVVVAYPGFYATAVYRLSHQIWQQGLHTLARLLSEYAHSKTGIDIHPAARIGEAFAIDHGTGIVVGETTDIGNNVKIYQGVTLGALSVDKKRASTKRHPTIEDGVVIYSGATILGGETVIGSGSIIGGNVWLTYSVPPNSVVYHKSEIKVKDKNPFPEPLNYVI
jgi:serine O-acetyltransferase